MIRPTRLGIALTVALAVTTISASAPAQELPSRDPAAVGCDAERLDSAAAAFRALAENGTMLGGVLLVTRGDAVILHVAAGHRDIARKQPMQQDTLFRMASNTKAVTAAAILALVDDGKVELDDPASKWLPTFGDGEASAITVRQLLTHTSGFRIRSLFMQPLMRPSADHPTAPNLVLEAARFAEVGPAVEPGTTYSYSNPGYNTLAAIVEVASGQPFERFCRARFYEPIGMPDSNHHESTADQSRMATVARKANDGWRSSWSPGDPPTVPFVRGSGGMISTARDFARFCRVFLQQGRHGETTILSPAMTAAATRSQTEHIEGHSYGFGWTVGDDGSFAHGGSDGTFAWCDPKRDLVGIFFTQTQGSPDLGKSRDAIRELIAAACPAR